MFAAVTFFPSWPKGHAAWQNLVAVLGTTIRPYLFFWQTSQEVEEEKAMGRRMLVERRHPTRDKILDRKLDVTAGTFFSNLVIVNPIKALFWSAVINGVLAPFLLLGILLVASDREIMRGEASSRLSRVVVGITAVAMFGAAIAMFIF